MAELEFTPVFFGSAYRNKGVQPLLDAVVRCCPRRWTCETKAYAWSREGSHEEMLLDARSARSRPWRWRSRSSKTLTAR